MRTKAQQDKIEQFFGKLTLSKTGDEFVFITDVMKESEFLEKADKLGVISKIRVLDA